MYKKFLMLVKEFLENLWEPTRIYFVGLGKVSYDRLVRKDIIFLRVVLKNFYC